MRNIETTQIVDAPADQVWSVLTDTGSYGRWNPFVTELSGELVPGATLTVRVAPPGARPMTFRPTVTVLEPGRRLEWLGRLGIPGVFDGRHMFTLEQLTDGRTRLTQSERFTGLLLPLMARLLANTEAGFKAMNAALADEVALRAAQPEPSHRVGA